VVKNQPPILACGLLYLKIGMTKDKAVQAAQTLFEL